MVNKREREKLKDFIEAIKAYSRGESPEGFRVFIFDKEGNRKEVVDICNIIDGRI